MKDLFLNYNTDLKRKAFQGQGRKEWEGFLH